MKLLEFSVLIVRNKEANINQGNKLMELQQRIPQGLSRRGSKLEWQQESVGKVHTNLLRYIYNMLMRREKLVAP